MKKYIFALSALPTLLPLTCRALPLIPMPQTYLVDEGGSLTGQFEIAVSDFSVFVTGADSTDIFLRLPDGSLVGETTAANLGITWQSDISEISNEPLVTIESPNASPGSYGLSLTARNDEKASFSVQEDGGLQYRTLIGNPGEKLFSDRSLPISVILFHDAFPATGASVDVQILDQDGNAFQSVTLLDDGQSPDLSADDGVYTAVVTFTGAGDFQGLFQAQWQGHQGRVFEPISVNPQDIEINGELSQTTIDNDNDGLVDVVALTFEEAQSRLPDSTYSVTVEIKDANDRAITETAAISDPDSPLTIIFDVKKLASLGPQPWLVSSLNIWKGPVLLGVWHGFGELTVDPSTFERDAMQVLGVSGDRGIDADEDGLFDTLEVDIGIDTQVSGNYGISTDLRSADSTLIGNTGISGINLAQGVNTVTLSFMGSNIGGVGKHGPFKITNFLIYPNFYTAEKLSKLIPFAGSTAPYSCGQFVGCGSDLESEIRRIADKMCDLQGHLLLVKLNRIHGIANKQPEVAEKQLEALYHRAKAIEHSGSCPPANGWPGDH